MEINALDSFTAGEQLPLCSKRQVSNVHNHLDPFFLMRSVRLNFLLSQWRGSRCKAGAKRFLNLALTRLCRSSPSRPNASFPIAMLTSRKKERWRWWLSLYVQVEKATLVYLDAVRKVLKMNELAESQKTDQVLRHCRTFLEKKIVYNRKTAYFDIRGR
jgi:hypothetical protein